MCLFLDVERGLFAFALWFQPGKPFRFLTLSGKPLSLFLGLSLGFFFFTGKLFGFLPFAQQPLGFFECAALGLFLRKPLGLFPFAGDLFGFLPLPQQPLGFSPPAQQPFGFFECAAFGFFLFAGKLFRLLFLAGKLFRFSKRTVLGLFLREPLGLFLLALLAGAPFRFLAREDLRLGAHRRRRNLGNLRPRRSLFADVFFKLCFFAAHPPEQRFSRFFQPRKRVHALFQHDALGLRRRRANGCDDGLPNPRPLHRRCAEQHALFFKRKSLPNLRGRKRSGNVLLIRLENQRHFGVFERMQIIAHQIEHRARHLDAGLRAFSDEDHNIRRLEQLPAPSRKRALPRNSHKLAADAVACDQTRFKLHPIEVERAAVALLRREHITSAEARKKIAQMSDVGRLSGAFSAIVDNTQNNLLLLAVEEGH